MDRTKLWIAVGAAALGLAVWGAETHRGSVGNVVAGKTASGSASAPVVRVQPPVQPDIVLPAGTPLRIRLDQAVGTADSRRGDRFSGTLIAPVSFDGAVALPAGASVGGYVAKSVASGRLKGRAILSLRLSSVVDDGQPVQISTATDTRVSAAHLKHNLRWIGAGGGGGAIVGALAGGPVGALIGAGSGAAAGTAGAAITGRREVRLPAETELTFHLTRSIELPKALPRG